MIENPPEKNIDDEKSDGEAEIEEGEKEVKENGEREYEERKQEVEEAEGDERLESERNGFDENEHIEPMDDKDEGETSDNENGDGGDEDYEYTSEVVASIYANFYSLISWLFFFSLLSPHPPKLVV